MLNTSMPTCSCTERPSQFEAQFFAGETPVKRSLLKLIAQVMANLALRSAEKQLQDLDDRMLKDIGLHRSEISSVLRDTSGDRHHDALIVAPGYGVLGSRCNACR